MISIIVSSYNKLNFENFCTSIAKTIGVEYEIIKIYNPGLMGICEAYNIGAKKAKFPFLCFSHEDILFNTKNWGIDIINKYNSDKRTGIIGVAGGVYKSYTPSGWFSSVNKNYNFSNVNYSVSQIEDNNKSKLIDEYIEVATLDGCFLITKSKIWADYKFDQLTFRKYHCYDLDFSLNVGQHYKLYVSKNINITHHSHGNFNSEWLFETYKLHLKWNNILPKKTIKINKRKIIHYEYNEFLNYMNTSFQYKNNMIEIYKILLTFKSLKLFGLKNWFILLLKSFNRVLFLLTQ